MQSSLWKLAVIAGVVALCLLVIDHAGKDIAKSPGKINGDLAETNSDGSQSSTDDDDSQPGNLSEPPSQPHEMTGDAVSHADLTQPHAGAHVRVAQTRPAVAVHEPFADDFDAQSSDTEIDPLPLAAQGEPTVGAPTAGDNSVPGLWNDPSEPEVAESASVPVPNEEIPPYNSQPVGVFDAAVAASTAEENNVEPLTEEPIGEPVPEDGDAPLEAMPAEDFELGAEDVAPLEPSAEINPTTEIDPFDFSGSDDAAPLADDVALPTAGDEDAPAESVFLEEPLDNAALEEMPVDAVNPLTNEIEIDAAPVMVPAEEAEEGLLVEEPNEFAESEAPEVGDENLAEEPAIEVPFSEDAEPELMEPELSADGEPSEIPAIAEDDPFAEQEPLTDADPGDAIPLSALPVEEDAAVEEMPAEEIDAPTPETVIIEPEPFATEPETAVEPESVEEVSTKPVDDVSLEPVPEPETAEPTEEETQPELLPAETIPQRESVPDAPAEEPLPAETPSTEPQPETASETLVPADDEVVGEGTVNIDAPRGPQKPQLTIEKQSPPTAILGKPFIYSIIVKNVGPSAAGRVTVEDEVPLGAKLTGTIPQAELIDKKLIWKFGILEPGQERKISIRVIPTAEGPIGSVAVVNFVAEVAAQTVVQKPELNVTMNAPPQVALGKPVVFQFKVSNQSAVPAKKVILRDILSSHFTHPGGNDLEYEIGDVPGGQTREVQLTLTAAEIGVAVNRAVVTAEGNVTAKAEAEITIVDQGVSITRVGPKNRLLKRAASYTNSIRNKAKAPVQDIVVVEKIPEGMMFVKASQGGNFDPQQNTVTWHIQQIAGEESEDVSVMLLPEVPGSKESVIQVFSESRQIGATTAATEIHGFAMLDAEISHLKQPVEVGERTSYRIEIHNRGSEPATQVLTSVLLPAEMKLINVKSPVEHKQTEQQIDFAEIAELAPGKSIAVDLLLEAATAGDTRLQVQVQCAEMKKPLNREAATLVFSDQQP